MNPIAPIIIKGENITGGIGNQTNAINTNKIIKICLMFIHTLNIPLIIFNIIINTSNTNFLNTTINVNISIIQNVLDLYISPKEPNNSIRLFLNIIPNISKAINPKNIAPIQNKKPPLFDISLYEFSFILICTYGKYLPNLVPFDNGLNM